MATDFEPDPIDVVRELLTAEHVDAAIISRVCRAARLRYGGCESYVRKRSPAETDAAIRRALERGLPTDRAAAAAGVSTSTIRRRRARWLG